LRDASHEFGRRGQFWGGFLKSIQLPDADREKIEKVLEEVNTQVINANAGLTEVIEKIAAARSLVELHSSDPVVLEAIPTRVFDMVGKIQVHLKSSQGAKLPLHRHGEGTQSLAVLLLFQAFTAASLAEAYAPESTPILALEEPEAHLHPSAVRSLGQLLKKMSGQILVSSHSGDLISRVPIRSIRRLYKENGETRVGRVREEDFSPRELQAIDYTVRLARGAYIFSRSWLLVEGESDYHLMPLLFEIMGYSQDQVSFSVLEISQVVDKGEPLIKFAKALGIQWFMMADGDDAGQDYVNRASKYLGPNEKLSDRVRRLQQPDIEHEFWHAGFDKFVVSKLTSKQEESIMAQSKGNAISLARVYRSYRAALRRSNSLDFPSLIAESLDLLEKHPFLVKHIRKVYKHILVDEFQDTNRSQYRMLSLITEPDPSTLFVVADDDQIIYQWNGANPKRIQSLREEFGVSEIQLPENYRCPSPVIELANALISRNLNRSAGKKPLSAVKQGRNGEVLRVFSFPDLERETRWIAEDIAARDAQDREKCAVLARTRKLLDVAGRELEKAGVPVYYAARKDEFRSAPLRMLHSILRLVNSREDRQSLARLSKAFHELEGIRVDISTVISRASADGQDLLCAWIEETRQRDALERDTAILLEAGIRPLLISLNFREFAENLLKWAERRQDTSQGDETTFNEFEEEREVWSQLLSEIAKRFEGEEVGLHQFLHELDLTSKTPPKPPGAIPCFTIHASKGMEFGHVYLMGLVEDQLPSWAAVKKPANSLEMQEERRNCFVAITRAQESLTLTFSRNVFGWPKKPSRFLSEMGIQF
jgi:DNA helicase-2/ATP-dependent DNA helicase PcrA